MAIIKSAKKAIRSSATKRLYNVRRKANIDSAKKKIIKLVGAGKKDDALVALKDLYKALDKAAKGKFLKKNTSDRLKSRMAKFVNRPVVSKK
jgi:small subunit ribosomal protein S20